MCGRYAITLPPEAVRSFFRYAEQPNFPPRYNLAPTQPVPVVRLERAPDSTLARHFVLMRWGFIPFFVKDTKKFPLLINARGETMAEKPSFRGAVKRRRCLFIADCFYEWQREGMAKGMSQPYMIRRADGAPFGFAALALGFTCTSGLSPTVGEAPCAHAAPEYSTATSTNMILMAFPPRFQGSGEPEVGLHVKPDDRSARADWSLRSATPSRSKDR